MELARRGADIAVCDLGHDLASVGYPLSTADDLAETARLVEEQGRACSAVVADVRDLEAMVGFVDGAVAALGSADILVANAGVSTLGSICTMDASEWSETIDTNLTGVFNAMRAAAPHMRRRRWGRIIGISSMMGRSSNPGIPAYVASKWGVIGLCKSVAYELAAFGVTVNAIAPGNVSTPMIHNDVLYGLMRPDLDQPHHRRCGPGHGRPPCPARPVAGAGGDHRGRGLPGLRGRPPHHRLGDRRGCRRLGPLHRVTARPPLLAAHGRSAVGFGLGRLLGRFLTKQCHVQARQRAFEGEVTRRSAG